MRTISTSRSAMLLSPLRKVAPRLLLKRYSVGPHPIGEALGLCCLCALQAPTRAHTALHSVECSLQMCLLCCRDHDNHHNPVH